MKKVNLILILSLVLLFKFDASSFAQDGAGEFNELENIIDISILTDDMKIRSIEISPNGKSVVLAMKENGLNYLLIGDLVDKSMQVRQILMKDKDKYVTNPRWATDERIVFTLNFETKIQGTQYKVNSRLMYAVNRDGSEFIPLRTDGRKAERSLKHIDSSDLIHILPKEPDHILIGKSQNRDWYADYTKGMISDVHKMNIKTGEMELYMKAPKIKGVKLQKWYADNDGYIRLGFGADRKNKLVMLIRGKNDDDWKTLSDNELFEEGKFFPLQFGSEPNEFYVLSSLATGRLTIFRFDIATGELDGKVYEHESVDVGGIIYSYEKGKVLAATFHDQSGKIEYFDDEYRIMRNSLNEAIGSGIYIDSQSEDEKNMIITGGENNDPGSYYHYDANNRTISYLGSNLLGFTPDQIALTEPFSYESRDGITIAGYITTPVGYVDEALPTIILPHSEPDGRSYSSWSGTVKYLANRGYVVIQPNFRGSSGYGSHFMSLGKGEWGRDMQNDLADAAHWAIEQGYTHKDKICIMGRRYAGYAALMGITKDADLYKCAISWAGISDIRKYMRENKSYNPDDRFYKDIAGELKKKQLDIISPIELVENVKGAVLLVHGEDDGWHNVSHSEKFAKALRKKRKSFDFYEMEEAGHYLNEASERKVFFELVENFLAEHNPTDVLLEMKAAGKLPKKHKMNMSN